MFITRKHLSRRTFLGGAGAVVALPLLEAMIPARTALAQTAASPTPRFGFIYVPHGTIDEQWTPAQDGAGFELAPILKPLESFRDYVNVYTGLDSNGAPGHSPSTGMWLSGAFPARGSTILLNKTADQHIAEKIGRETTFPSMEFATEDHSSHLGSCAGDFLCSYMSTISWRTPTQPLPMEINPRVVFERMFGGDGRTREARLARLEQSTSILDAVAESVQELQGGLGPRDRAKLDEYLENVREIERRIIQAESQRDARGLEAPATPVGIPESFEEHVDLMFELQALAFQGDLTRVTTFMMARELSTLSYPQIGVADGHHPVSHNNGVAEQIIKKVKVDTYHVTRFVKFLERLQSTADGDGTLFDHSLFVYGSGMKDGNQHNHVNLPMLTAGGAAGKLKGGRHLRFEPGTPLANLMLAVMDIAGVGADGFGLGNTKSTGPLEI